MGLCLLPASAGGAHPAGAIPGSGRSPGGGNAAVLAWRIPWSEKPGSCSAWGRRGEDTTEHACTHVLHRHGLGLGTSDQSGQVNDEQGTHGVACWEQRHGLASPSGRKKHACCWAGRSGAGRPLVGKAGKTRDGKWVVCGAGRALWYQGPLCVSAEGSSARDKVVDKK